MPGELAFRTPLRRGVLPLADLVSVSPEWMSLGRAYVIRTSRRRPIVITGGPGLSDFFASLREVAPHVPVIERRRLFSSWSRSEARARPHTARRR